MIRLPLPALGLGLALLLAAQALALPPVPQVTPEPTQQVQIPGLQLDQRLPNLDQLRPDPLAAGLVVPTNRADLSSFGGAPPAQAGPLNTAMAKAEPALASLRNASRCLSEGLDAPGCDARKLATDTACILGGAAPNPNNPFFLLARASPTAGAAIAKLYDLLFSPSNPFCFNGSDAAQQAALKCCKYTPDQLGCHSAFNQPAPINCEGNPGFAGTAASFGPCLGVDGSEGCVCDYLIPCEVGGPRAQLSVQASAFFASDWFTDLIRAYQDALATQGQAGEHVTLKDLERLTTFQGCKGRLDVLQSADPFRNIQPGVEMEYLQISAVQQGLANIAALRVMLAVPNALLRLDAIRTRTWDAASRQAALSAAGVTNPDGALLTHLSPAGLLLLKASMPLDYVLLAVPAPNEPPSGRPAGARFEDGCELGLPPEVVELTSAPMAGADPGTVTTRFRILDPEAGTAGVGYLAIDWGDGRIDTHLIYTAGESIAAAHVYTEPGKHLIQVTATNVAGLSDSEHTQVDLPVGSCNRVLSSVVSVGLEGSLRRIGTQKGDLSFFVLGRDERSRTLLLGSHYQHDVRGTDPLGTVRFENPSLGPVKSLEIRIRRHAGLAGGRLVLDAIHLLERTEGFAGTQDRVFAASGLSATGGRVTRTRDGSLELRTDETYTIPLPVGVDGTRTCGNGSNP